jgi:hypothetical protein
MLVDRTSRRAFIEDLGGVQGIVVCDNSERCHRHHVVRHCAQSPHLTSRLDGRCQRHRVVHFQLPNAQQH